MTILWVSLAACCQHRTEVPPNIILGKLGITLCLFSLPVSLFYLKYAADLRLTATHLQLLSGQLVPGLGSVVGLGRKAHPN